MKTTYFPHYCLTRHDNKIMRLEAKHGMLGYGVFWAILELLYSNNNLIEYDIAVLAYNLRVDEAVVADIVENYGLFELVEGKIKSKTIEKHIEEIKTKSEKYAQNAKKRWQKKDKHAFNDEICEENAKNEPESNTQTTNEVISEEKNDEKATNQQDEKVEVQKEKLPVKDVIDYWNQTCTMLPKVEKLTERRRQKIRLRLNEIGIDKVKFAIEKVSKSKFLNGNNKNNWHATFDWLFANSENILKVLEGNYDDRKPSANDNYKYNTPDVDNSQDKYYKDPEYQRLVAAGKIKNVKR